MLLKEFDVYIHGILPFEEGNKADDALNGLQVGRENQEVGRVAFAVDASMETFSRARQEKADLVFVHHGLFWGFNPRIEGNIRRRLKFLFDSDMALYAVHIPLDLAHAVGNNAQIAAHLGLLDQKPFGVYHGVKIGIMGRLPLPMTINAVSTRLLGKSASPVSVLSFGQEKKNTVGIVSGGAAMNAFDAIAAGLDLYITGEASHTVYHECMEAGVSAIFGGHYATETWGVKALAQKCAADLGLSTVFIDVPTGL